MNKQISQKQFASTRRFHFPEGIVEHSVQGKHLLIAPSRANWLVFDDSEFETFNFLKNGMSISETLSKLTLLYDNCKAPEVLKKCLIQLEYKRFYKDTLAVDRMIYHTGTIYITNGCNLRCKHCYMLSEKPAIDECSTKQWINALDQFRDMGGEIITFTGGEPLIRKDFCAVAKHAKRIGFRVVLLTNGTLVSKWNSRILGKICDEIQISIDGPNEETNDSIRGKGNFKKAIQALCYLSPHPSRLSIAMTPLPTTISVFRAKLPDFVEWVQKRIRRKMFIRVSPQLLEGRQLGCLKQSEQNKFSNEVIKLCNECIEEDYFEKTDAAAFVPNIRLPNCGYAESLIFFGNGDVKPCGLSSTIVGNMSKTSLSSLLEKLRELYETTRVEKMEKCSLCDLRYFCGGKCKVENIKINNNGGGIGVKSLHYTLIIKKDQ